MTTPAGAAAGAAGPTGGAAGSLASNQDPQSPTQAVAISEADTPQTLTDSDYYDTYQNAPTS